jgi:hypothetical protein
MDKACMLGAMAGLANSRTIQEILRLAANYIETAASSLLEFVGR